MTIKHWWYYNNTVAAKPINIDLSINSSDFSEDLSVLHVFIYFFGDAVLLIEGYDTWSGSLNKTVTFYQREALKIISGFTEQLSQSD